MKRWLILFAALLLPWAAAATCSDCAGSAGYVTITVDAAQVEEAIGYAPIYLSDMPGDFHSAMDAVSDTTGESIRVTTADGSTECSIYVLDVDTGTDTGMVIFELVGVSASVNTDYRVYVGNASATMYAATDTYGQYAVFPASVTAFYPLCGASPLNNAAQNAYHLTASGSPSTSSNGPTEGTESYLFSGSAQYLYSSTTPSINWPVAISAWFNSDSITLSQTIAAFADSGQADNYGVLEAAGSVTSDPIRWRSYGDGGSERIATSSAAYSADTWMFAQGGYDGSAGYARISGANTGTQTADPVDGDFNTISIAVARRSSLTNYFDGEISLVEYSDVGRSANYAITMYRAFHSGTTFYTAGAWTTGGGAETGSFFFG